MFNNNQFATRNGQLYEKNFMGNGILLPVFE